MRRSRGAGIDIRHRYNLRWRAGDRHALGLLLWVQHRFPARVSR
jgi:hypothetical protein